MVTLYRPVGLNELELIIDSKFTAFPPRLPEQPIFYPVMNREYAKQIASDWNVKYGSGKAGFVTEFDMDDSYIRQYEVQTVGNATHKELWVPADQLTDFNYHIIGAIRVVDAFYGNDYSGLIPRIGAISGLDAKVQLIKLNQIFEQDRLSFNFEIEHNWKVIFINYKFWSCYTFIDARLNEPQKSNLLDAIAENLKYTIEI